MRTMSLLLSLDYAFCQVSGTLHGILDPYSVLAADPIAGACSCFAATENPNLHQVLLLFVPIKANVIQFANAFVR